MRRVQRSHSEKDDPTRISIEIPIHARIASPGVNMWTYPNTRATNSKRSTVLAETMKNKSEDGRESFLRGTILIFTTPRCSIKNDFSWEMPQLQH